MHKPQLWKINKEEKSAQKVKNDGQKRPRVQSPECARLKMYTREMVSKISPEDVKQGTYSKELGRAHRAHYAVQVRT